ncbi:hypothetical protein [Brevundimonas sp.]|uniref:hypothetical protein n=1 Tax=Brevundimonas sp. TaxID=1871086 RepID=UPI001A187075|nr:hypothetical protein [Brevundimonas sp.]MBJ7483212.1 hypothetical protein [Brevundimonas sp.]
MTLSRLVAFLVTPIMTALALSAAGPALAQIENGIPPNELNAGYIMEAEREVLRNMQRLNAQTRREPPAQSLANAQAAVTAAGADCRVAEAKQLGRTAENASIYEAVCQAGPGYLVINSTPPQAVSCIVAAQAATQDAAKPADETTFVCTMPANQNGMAVLAAYAREAGIQCQVDFAGPVGTANGQTVYEIGCAGLDGYRLKRTDAGWEKTECWIIVSAGSRCASTTPEEQFATMKARLAGTDAAACDVNGGRFMGANANGAFYEARCAGSDGFIFHVKDEVTDRVIPCAIAAPIGGGCTLTPVRAAMPAPAAPTPSN